MENKSRTQVGPARYVAMSRLAIGGVPVTGPARTLLDMARTCDDDVLADAVNAAKAASLVSNHSLMAVMKRYPGREGCNALMSHCGDRGFSRSLAETLMSKLIRDKSLPEPQQNAHVHGYEVDFYWPEYDLVVEVDGYAFHSGKRTFEKDRQRDLELRGHDITVVRLTWTMITKEPDAVAATLRYEFNRPRS